jgi:hypothetical protein
LGVPSEIWPLVVRFTRRTVARILQLARPTRAELDPILLVAQLDPAPLKEASLDQVHQEPVPSGEGVVEPNSAPSEATALDSVPRESVLCGEANELSRSDHLWRKFRNSDNHVWWSDEDECWLPTPAALQFDPELSTQWREHLESHGLGPDSILDVDKGYELVGEWYVSRLEDLNFPVKHTPDLEVPLIGCSHSSVYWPSAEIPPGKAKPNKDARDRIRSDLSYLMRWMHGTITVPKPE